MTTQTTADDRSTDPFYDHGADCPAFVAERTFDGAAEGDIHTVELADPTVSITRERTVVRMVYDDDGGLVTFDDGQTVARRVYASPERAVEAFTSIVEGTATTYSDRGLEFDTTYDAGREPIEFDIDYEYA